MSSSCQLGPPLYSRLSALIRGFEVVVFRPGRYFGTVSSLQTTFVEFVKVSMPKMLSSRDFVGISDAARILGVSDQTLRNWDRAGRLRPIRHPINGYRIYRVADLHSLVRQFGPNQQIALEFEQEPSHEEPLRAPQSLPPSAEGSGSSWDLPPCHWSLEVALDPKHRPQRWDCPSSTVRRDWRKYPQEAHVLDASGTRYRRLIPGEIAILQGFDPSIVDLTGLSDREKIASLGDAVPPPLARALARGIFRSRDWNNQTAIEICAGIGGLAEGAANEGFEHLVLLDSSPVCGKLLSEGRSWSADRVRVEDVRDFSFEPFKGSVGLLSGGPPCQPWSRAGHRLGEADSRDLFSELPDLIGMLEPEAFLFENVPGLTSPSNRGYLDPLVARLIAPAPLLRYGVVIGQFNAANFGVPQVRERIFVLGLRDAPGGDAYRCFDDVASRQTNTAPGTAGTRCPPWVTIGDAIGHREDPGGWRRWITAQSNPT